MMYQREVSVPIEPYRRPAGLRRVPLGPEPVDLVLIQGLLLLIGPVGGTDQRRQPRLPAGVQELMRDGDVYFNS